MKTMEFTIWYWGEYGLGMLIRKAKDVYTLKSKLPKYILKGLMYIEDEDGKTVYETE